MPVLLQDIKDAARRIHGGIYYSPCPPSVPLSLVTGFQIYCKLDHLQRTGSFKERGALNSLLQLKPEVARRGVIAASAGNHALGLSYHGSRLNIPVTVVMPKRAPLTKITNCEQMGTRVILHGENFEDARLKAIELCRDEKLRYIHGFNDLEIIAGQGTMGLEILEQVPDVDAIIVPIGGGGLIAGLALAVKSLKAEVKIIGVEPLRAASFTAALKEGKPVAVSLEPTLADGLAVPCVGDLAFETAKNLVDRVVVVQERSIALSVLRLVELEKSVVEGAAAAALAACLEGLVPELKDRKVVLPLCGGNLDTSVLGLIIERGLAADGRLCRFSALISDRPGSLSKFTALVAEEEASIRDIDHDRAFVSVDINSVRIHCLVETKNMAHIQSLRARLAKEGFAVEFPQLDRDASGT